MSFTTYANYVGAFALLTGLTLSKRWDRGLAGTVPAVDAFLGRAAPATKPKWSGDLDQIERSLRSAWGTELLLLQQYDLVTETEDLARIVATWAVVQTYYTCYHSTQALIVACGRARPENHPSTQKQFLNEWSGRAGLLDPWTMKYDHAGHGRCTETIDDSLSNLTYPTERSAASLAAKALKTTWLELHDDRLEVQRTAKYRADKRVFDDEQKVRMLAGKPPRKPPSWYGKGKRNLTDPERTAVAAATPPAGLLHLLFRLRIKANYVDAQAFTDGPLDDFDGVKFVRDLTYLAAAAATAHEHRVRHEIGIDRVEAIRKKWITGPGRALAGRGPAAPYRAL